jgi:hypothetical protein
MESGTCKGFSCRGHRYIVGQRPCCRTLSNKNRNSIFWALIKGHIREDTSNFVGLMKSRTTLSGYSLIGQAKDKIAHCVDDEEFPGVDGTSIDLRPCGLRNIYSQHSHGRTR